MKRILSAAAASVAVALIATAAASQSSLTAVARPTTSPLAAGATARIEPSPFVCRPRCLRTDTRTCLPEVQNTGEVTYRRGTGVSLVIDGRDYGSPAFFLTRDFGPGDFERLPSPMPRFFRCAARPL